MHGSVDKLLNRRAPLTVLEPEAVAVGAGTGGVPLGLVRRPTTAPSGSRVGTRDRLRIPLIAADLASLAIGVAVGVTLGIQEGGHLSLAAGAVLAMIGVPLWGLLAHLNGLYSVDKWRSDHGTADELGRLVPITTLWIWGLLAGAWVLDTVNDVRIAGLLGMLVVAVAAQTTGRTIVRGWARRQVWYWQNALVIGRPVDATPLIHRIVRSPRYGIHVVALVDPVQRTRFVPEERRHVGPVPVVGETPSVAEIVKSVGVDRVVVVGSLDPDYERDVVCRLSELGVHVDLVPTWTEAFGGRLDVHALGGVPVFTAPREELGHGPLLMKRILDIVVSATALAVLSPLLVTCAIAIRINSPGPALFRQRRVGKDDRRFEVVKFRSMYIDAEQRKEEVARLNFHGGGMSHGMFKIRQDPRITAVGAFLRRSSLDELPQLINVLRGEMSLVGPRPLIENEHDQIPASHRSRVSIKPGLTGLWQVNGRSEIPFDEMVALDSLYVRSWSLAGDLKLILRTIGAVLRRQGAY